MLLSLRNKLRRFGVQPKKQQTAEKTLNIFLLPVQLLRERKKFITRAFVQGHFLHTILQFHS